MAKSKKKSDAPPKLEIKWVAPDQLIPYAQNTKLHTPDQVARIAAQVKAFGWDVPIVVDQNNVITKGHGRREAAMLLGLKKVPVIMVMRTSEHSRAARIGDNKVAEAPWINEVLRQEFLDLREAFGPDVADAVGFDSPELQSIIDGWSAAPANRADPEGDDPGLMARVSITCKQIQREKVVSCVESALKANGLADAVIS